MSKQFINNLLWWTWELPQTLFGFILKILWKGELNHQSYIKTGVGGSITFLPYYYVPNCPDWFPGVSLGKYILLASCYEKNPSRRAVTVKHEHGHQLQSRRWGPLYLITVGLVSGFYNLLARFSVKEKLYNFIINVWELFKFFSKEYADRARQANMFYIDYYFRYPEKQADKLAGVVRDRIL